MKKKLLKRLTTMVVVAAMVTGFSVDVKAALPAPADTCEVNPGVFHYIVSRVDEDYYYCKVYRVTGTIAKDESPIAKDNLPGFTDSDIGTTFWVYGIGGQLVKCPGTHGVPTVTITSVTLDKPSITLTVGDTDTLTAVVVASFDKADNKKVNWFSDDTEVATVDENGEITAKAEGSVTITATSTIDAGKTATCTVTVLAKSTPSPTPAPDPTPSKSEEKKESAKAAPVDLDTNKSEVAYGTVFMHKQSNVKDILDMKVHSVDARTKANQEFLAATYAKNQGKRARILTTTGIYPRNKLTVNDLGAKKLLSFVNLEKKAQTVYAVCYNQTDKAYYLTGTMNANGIAVFPDFIARDATNITIFVLE